MSIFSIFKRRQPLTVTEALKQPPFDAWPKLAAKGYTMESYPVRGGKHCYSFYKDGAALALYTLEDGTEEHYSRPLSVDDAMRMREQWAKMELARLESEGE